MIWLALVMSAACIVLLVWQVQTGLGPALRRYREIYTQETSVRFSEVFLFVSPTRLWAWAVTASLVFGGLCLALTGSVIVAGGMVVVVVRLPHYLVRHLRRQRSVKFEQQLPAALLALSCALRSGAGLSTALSHVTAHSEAPLSQEFGLVLREQRLGVTFDRAWQHLRDRMPSEASALLVAALRVAFHTGGNLAETLEGIAYALRDQLRVHGKLRTLTAQGRLQAWIVGALPVLLLGALTVLEPDMMTLLWRTPIGWGVIAALCVFETAGVLMIRRIVNVEV